MRAQPERRLEIVDRRLGLPGLETVAARHPPARQTGIEQQSPINDGDRRADILAEIPESAGDEAEDVGIIVVTGERLARVPDRSLRVAARSSTDQST